MSCSYCSVFARNPCTDKQEASKCNNNSDPGACFDFNPREVAMWIRANCYGDDILEKAADAIEDRM